VEQPALNVLLSAFVVTENQLYCY